MEQRCIVFTPADGRCMFFSTWLEPIGKAFGPKRWPPKSGSSVAPTDRYPSPTSPKTGLPYLLKYWFCMTIPSKMRSLTCRDRCFTALRNHRCGIGPSLRPCSSGRGRTSAKGAFGRSTRSVQHCVHWVGLVGTVHALGRRCAGRVTEGLVTSSKCIATRNCSLL